MRFCSGWLGTAIFLDVNNDPAGNASFDEPGRLFSLGVARLGGGAGFTESEGFSAPADATAGVPVSSLLSARPSSRAPGAATSGESGGSLAKQKYARMAPPARNKSKAPSPMNPIGERFCGGGGPPPLPTARRAPPA